ncbi:MAG: magnesium transporter [archaeon]
MKQLIKHLEKIRKLDRRYHHPLLHKVHKKHRISKKTLFYVKEYGPHSNVPKTIIKESIKILLLASIISSFGGFTLEHIKEIFISITPLLILFPALNDMIGDYGTIISSRFSTMLHEGGIKKNVFKDNEIRTLFFQVFIISIITSLLSCLISFVISYFSGYSMQWITAVKIVLLVLIDVILLISLLFVTSLAAGMYFYKKNEDPNNFLIPITTSIADFGNMLILSALVILFF